MEDQNRLLKAIGTTAIVWYFIAILYLGFGGKMAREPKPASQPSAGAPLGYVSRGAPGPTGSASAAGASVPTPSATPSATAGATANPSATPSAVASASPSPAVPPSPKDPKPQPSVKNLPDFMALTIVVIGGTLATFVGMVIGRGLLPQADADAPPAEVSSVSNWQSAAAYAYLGSLVLALLFWWGNGDACDPAVANLGQSFLGLVGGALTVMLNVSPQVRTDPGRAGQ